jgi:hypothetical protein
LLPFGLRCTYPDTPIMIKTTPDQQQDIRAAVLALCAGFLAACYGQMNNRGACMANRRAASRQTSDATGSRGWPVARYPSRWRLIAWKR